MLSREFSFDKVESIAIIAFHEDTILLSTSNEQYHLPEIPVELPVSFCIRSFLLLVTKNVSNNPYFVGVHGTIAYFTLRVSQRLDWFVPEYAFLSVESAFQKLNIDSDVKAELFYRAYELIKP